MKQLLVAATLLVAGCLKSGDVSCNDGRTCPEGTLCRDELGLCVSQKQLDACAGLEDGADCNLTPEVEACQSGVCIDVTCGNGRTDPTEACDDGDTLSGNGCSADCKSKETCGNNYVDIARGELCDDGNFVDHDGCSSTCGFESAVWQPVFTTASARKQAGLAYDSARDRVVLVGGIGNRVIAGANRPIDLEDVLEWDGRWHPSSAQPPPPRTGFGVAYDSKRKRTLLYGGLLPTPIGDLWEFDGTTWKRLSVDGPPRAHAAVAYDPIRDLFLVVGGTDVLTGQPKAETWAWNGTTWNQLAVPSPFGTAPRSQAALAFDPKRGKIVLFGGLDTTTPGSPIVRGDLWELDANGWQAKAASNPPSARYGAAMAWNGTCNCIVLMGGFTDTTFNPTMSNQVFTWNGTTWSNITPPSQQGPEARGSASFTNDGHGRSILVGGIAQYTTSSSDPDRLYNDTWIFDGTTWTRQDVRVNTSAAFDLDRHRVVLYGGGMKESGPERTQDTYELSDLGWQHVASVGPNTVRPQMAYDEARHVTVLYGGDDGAGGRLGETWSWNGSAWGQLPATQQATPVAAGAMVYDAKRAEMVAFGGVTASGSLIDETWTWNGTTWTKKTPATSPSPRSGMAMTYDYVHERVVLFGGYTGTGTTGYDSSTWTWDGTTWTMQAAPGPTFTMVGRAYMGWDASRRRVLLASGDYLESWEWDGAAWLPLAGVGNLTTPDAGIAFSAYSGSGITVTGGYNASGDDTGTYELRYVSEHPVDTCRPPVEHDGDMRSGCMDVDCWTVCTPDCMPGETCEQTSPRCGDGTCDVAESCRSCAADCMTCGGVCGDGVCDPAEACPGDCAP